MGKSEKKEEAGNGRTATEAQIRLINALFEETLCNEIPEHFQKKEKTRDEASALVHFLKEYKIRDQALRAANRTERSFDKIGFGMVYKLVWKAASELPTATKPTERMFTDIVVGEYDVFKAAQKACREHVEEGGRQ